MRDVDHLQFQTDTLLDRGRYLRHRLRLVYVVAGVAVLKALEADWWSAIGLPVALVVWDAIVSAYRERKADKILDKHRVLSEDFDEYAEAEKQLQEELAEIEKKKFVTEN